MTIPETTWKMRASDSSDDPALVALWNEVFGQLEPERGSLAYRTWQYRQNPFGEAVTWVAQDRDKLVGQYAVIPIEFERGMQRIHGSLSLDTMTHLDYRGQGIFTKLANALYDDLASNDILVTYGFPNENSIGGFTRRLEWAHICNLPIYVRPLRLAGAAAAVLSGGMGNLVASTLDRPFGAYTQRTIGKLNANPGQITRYEAIDERFTALWQTARPREKTALIRSAQYLQWRYLENPIRSYEVWGIQLDETLQGYAVVREMELFGVRGMMITELVVDPSFPETSRKILGAVLNNALEHSIDLCVCSILGAPGAIKGLKEAGFFKLPERLSPKTWYFGARLNTKKGSTANLLDPKAWYLTFGDTDII